MSVESIRDNNIANKLNDVISEAIDNGWNVTKFVQECQELWIANLQDKLRQDSRTWEEIKLL